MAAAPRCYSLHAHQVVRHVLEVVVRQVSADLAHDLDGVAVRMHASPDFDICVGPDRRGANPKVKPTGAEARTNQA